MSNVRRRVLCGNKAPLRASRSVTMGALLKTYNPPSSKAGQYVQHNTRLEGKWQFEAGHDAEVCTAGQDPPILAGYQQSCAY